MRKPVAMPGMISGMMTRKKAIPGLHPRSRAAS